ncbi:hypothetical protein ACOMHN_063136 [Nucella lapillus]
MDKIKDVDDEKSHARLLDAISTMDGSKRLTHTLRGVHGQAMSETGLASSVPADALMSDLMGSLEQSASFSKIKKQLQSVFKPGTGAVNTPAPKHLKEKIQRTVGYEKTVKDISRWEPVVTANRKAPQLRFPMQRVTQRMLDQQITYRPVTDLEKEMKELDKKSRPENKIPKGDVFTRREQEEMAAMSLEEAKARRAQLITMRTIIYNRNSKLHWQNKIKSKRYRRAKKKEKEKKTGKELEELAVRDPEALINKLEESDRKRILERGRLRHAGGKKFAREARIFSKYDDEKRQQLQEMLKKHQDLKKKDLVLSSSDSEDDDDGDKPGEAKLWMQPVVWSAPTPTEVLSPSQGPSTAPTPQEGLPETSAAPEVATETYEENENSGENDDDLKEESEKGEESEQGSEANHDAKEKGKGKKKKKQKTKEDEVKETEAEMMTGETREESTNEEKKRKKKKPTKKDQTNETKAKTTTASKHTKKDRTKAAEAKTTAASKHIQKDRTRETEAKTTTTIAPKEKEDRSEKVKELLMSIEEAFDDDDVVEQFMEEKEQMVEEEQEKDVDTFLPGWGRWAGPGIQESPALRKRFIVKATPTIRKDNEIGHVVFTTKKNANIEKHQLKKLPHPYQSEDHMRKVLSTPLTRDNSRPKVVVARSGQIIPPLQESVLLQVQGPKRKAADIELQQNPSGSAKSKKRRRRR